MKQQNSKILIISLAIFTLINLGFTISVFTIWNKQKDDDFAVRQEIPQKSFQDLQDEIGFNGDQVSNFHKARREFREEMRPIQRKLRQLNHELIIESTSANPDTAICNELSNRIGQYHIIIKQLLSKHLMQVSLNTTPKQRVELEKFYLNMFDMPAEGPGYRMHRHRRGQIDRN